MAVDAYSRVLPEFDPFSLYDLTQSVAEAKRPEDIFEAALQCLKRGLGVEKSSILLFDPDGVMRFKAWAGLSAQYRAAVEGHSPWEPSTRDAQPVLVPDVLDDPDLESLMPIIQAEGIRSLAFIPLTIRGKLLGKFMLYYAAPHDFTSEEIQLARTIAANVALAIDQQRAQLERELSEILLAGQKQSMELLVAGAPLQEVLASLTCLVEALSAGATVSSIMLIDKEGRLHNGASPSLPQWYLDAIDGLPADADFGTCCAAAARREPVFTPDFETDVRWEGFRHLPLSLGFKGAWSQPVLNREGEVLGTFGTYFSECRYPTESERRIVEVLAKTAAIAIERKAAEDKLQLHAAIFRNALEGVAIIDPEGRYTEQNHAHMRLLGFADEDLAGKTPAIHLGDETFRRIAEALVETGTYRGEVTSVTRTGERLVLDLSAFAVRDEHGNVKSYVGAKRDVTRERLAQEALSKAIEELKAASAIKDQFLDLVSHELRTPITMVLGNALLLQQRAHLLSDPDKTQCLEDIRSEAERLHQIIENLLVITRTEGHKTIDLEPIKLESIAAQAVASSRRRRPFREVTLEAGSTLPTALGIPSMLQLLFENLIGNADKYSADGRPIRVTVRGNDGVLEACVSDDGVGLDEAEIASLFTPFYRSQRTSATTTGMGLGLAVCQRIADVHGGAISARNRPEGGADFIFTLSPMDTRLL